MNGTRKIEFECPSCSEIVIADVPAPSSATAPAVRGNIQPRDTIYEYRITSSEIREFCAAKLNYYKPGASLTLLPVPAESNSKRKGNRVGFAAMHLAFSSDIIESHENGFLDRVGIDPNNVQIVKDVWVKLFKPWMIDVNELRDIRKDYRRLEAIKDYYNINESYLDWLITYGTPRKTELGDGRELVVIAARADAILKDILEEVDGQEGKFRGSLKIVSANRIDEHNMEFIVHVSRTPAKADSNPEIVQMMKDTRIK